MRLWMAIGYSLAVVVAGGWLSAAAAQPDPASHVVEIRFRPTRFAQIAVWIEDTDGNLVQTVGLTEATARRGVGNRPGASQMNSGFRWPYGRREGILPTWGYRRAHADGAQQFRRVIFQDRTTEGLASRTSNDFSADDYFCLSFDRNHANKEALDAVSCASLFNSDKGRFITPSDVADGYSEPFEDLTTGNGRMEPLSEFSPYPPRMDVAGCFEAPGCNDHEDVGLYRDHVREVMPEIDAVTMPTPQGDADKRLLFSVPADWEVGDYSVCVEVNVEGDYNGTYSAEAFPTPQTPTKGWDSWARSYGYPYRGQPSVVYCTGFTLGSASPATSATSAPDGSVSTWDTSDPDYGLLNGMDGMTDDPVDAPGVGADRLRPMDNGDRLRVIVMPPLSCEKNTRPGTVSDVSLQTHGDPQHAHEWAQLRFAAATDDNGIFSYDVRVSTDPIDNEQSFMQAERAKNATIEAQELVIPTDHDAGDMVHVEVGGLAQATHYYVAVRAIDGCAQTGEFEVTEFETPTRSFTTVSACFVATAAYGTPLTEEIGALRRLRDRQLQNNVFGRFLVEAYYSVGPGLADLIADRANARAVTRWVLAPLVWAARALDP